MSPEGSFRIISVAGAHSRVGKTTLCSILLRELKGFGAIKFTKDLFDPPLIDNEEIILQRGKDTAIMIESGAEKVMLISGHGERLKNALDTALKKMSSHKGVVIEGNSPIEFLMPDLLIFVIGPDRQIKPPAMEIGRMANIVVINSERIDKDTSFISDMLQEKTRIFFIDLKKNEGEIRPLLSYIKTRLSEI